MMMKKCQCGMSKLAGFLVIIGGLNWGLVGVGMLMHSNWDVVNLLLGSWPTVEAVIYILVGIATIMMMVGCKCAKCKACMAGGMTGSAPMGGSNM